MRLFIGIPLAPAVSERLAALRSHLERAGDGLRWSSPESWHITLQFLGAAIEVQYGCVLEQLEKLTAPSVLIRLEEPGFFDRAGIFYVSVSVTPQLTHLQQMITRATSHCGFEPEDRPYRPHITLARRKGQSGSSMRDLKRRLDSASGSAPKFPSFTAHEFVLYESILGPTGSRYEDRARFPLAAG